ncbi:MAG: SBBP repeat-containing protein [Acidobacteriota bacterium]|nr:SBBP repeat-containing protein [Acidobacteriota bacterium]
MAAACLEAAVPLSANQKLVPLTFEPNRGQAPGTAQFVARGAGYYLTLDRSGSRMLLRQGKRAAEIRTTLAGCAPGAELKASAPLPGHSAYFRGNDPSKWVTGIPNFAQVKMDAVYPGIDLVYYGNQSRLEYDFVVAPHADSRQIRMHFEGVSSLRTDPEGNLVLKTSAGELSQHRPVVYQVLAGVRQAVAGDFEIGRGNTVRFRVGSYDRAAPLVIDPVLVYSSFLGGTDTDEGHSVASDGAANMYLTGVTFSTPAGDADVLVRKVSADGTAFLYTADLGGSGNDYGNGIAVDVNGYAFVGGRTASTDFPAVNAFQSTNYGANNAFVVRLDPAASSMVFSTYVGGSTDDRGYALALDRQGSVYLTGAASSTDFPTSQGAAQSNLRGGLDAFVVKFDYSGAAQFSTLLGGGSDDQAFGIAVDSNGNSYIAGQTNSDSFPQAKAPYQHSRHGGLDAFLSEISNDGTTLLFSTFIGGSGDDSAGGVAVDLSGNAYVVGTTASSDFPIPNQSYNTGFNGGAADIFVVKYFPGGQNIAWATFLGSHGTDDGNAIAVDPNGNVYVAGDTNSSQYPVTRDAIQPNRAGGYDAVLSVLDTNGLNLNYSTYYGGSGDDSALGVALDQYAEVYLTGSTASGDLPANNGVVQPNPGGGDSDAFLAKISVYGSAIPGATPSADPAPVTSQNQPSSTSSAFGRGMTAPSVAGKFTRARIHQGGAAIEPERFGRTGPQNVGGANR